MLLPHRDVVLVIGAIWKSSAPLTDMLALVFLVLGAGGSGKVRLAHWDCFELTSGEWDMPAEQMKALCRLG